jgi:hypothetical protein
MVDAARPVPLQQALGNMLRAPFVLLRDWNWKAALFSAVLRAIMFFLTNRHAGHYSGLKAMLVELVYATFAAGIVGAVTQRLRHATPRAATATVVWFLLPAIMLAAQAVVHYAMGTPRLRVSLIASFIFSAFATGFNWFAMSRGVFVTGEGRSFARDLLLVPRLILHFVTLRGVRSSVPE